MCKRHLTTHRVLTELTNSKVSAIFGHCAPFFSFILFKRKYFQLFAPKAPRLIKGAYNSNAPNIKSTYFISFCLANNLSQNLELLKNIKTLTDVIIIIVFVFCFFVFFCQSSWRKSAIHSQNSTIY